GAAQQEGQPANPLMTDFTSTGPKTFTGTVTVVRRVRRGLDGTLIVVVRNLAPRTTYEIVVQGVRIGTLTTNAARRGPARFRPHPGHHDQFLGVDPRGMRIAVHSLAGPHVATGIVAEHAHPANLV